MTVLAENLPICLVIDPDRPLFHVAPTAGWLNDPNGLIFYRGRFHLFYQHVEQGCEWQWGLVWGHAVSTDLAHWRHLPPALRPSPGGPDADGCWSGCCGVSREGTPTLLYTGVRLRSNKACGPLPPPDQDSGLLWIESQCVAVPEDPGDELLLRWRKLEAPAVALPPPGMNLTGWRDPFVHLGARSAEPQPAEAAEAAALRQQERTEQQEGAAEAWRGYRMLLGSGVKGRGGVLLAYSSGGGGSSSSSSSSSSNADGSSNEDSSTLAGPWQFECIMCSVADLADTRAELADVPAELASGDCGRGKGEQGGGSSNRVRAAHELGEVWECPLLAQLPPFSAGGSAGPSRSCGGGHGSSGDGDSSEGQWLLAVSPYPAKPPHSPSNPVLYWVGQLNGGGTRFDLRSAEGPHRLDRGDLLYAPNCCTDAKGRLILWAWIQERRAPGTAATYAGCLTLPRLLSASADGRRLVQQPVPELSLLRQGFPGSSSSRSSIEDVNICGGSVRSGGGRVGQSAGAEQQEEEEPEQGGATSCVGLHTAGWYAEGVEVAEGQPLWIQGVGGQQLDIELTLGRGSADSAGLLLLGHEAGSHGNALLTFCWSSNSLEVRFGVPAPSAGGSAAGPLHLQPPPAASSPRKQQQQGRSLPVSALTAAAPSSIGSSPAAAAVAAAAEVAVEAQLAELAEPLPAAANLEAAVAAEAAAAPQQHQRLVGGPLEAPAADERGVVRLRVLIDGSALEVFTGSGEVLTTRVYRGAAPARSGTAAAGLAAAAAAVEGAAAVAAEPVAAAEAAASECGIAVVAVGGNAVLENGAAWEMGGCWVD